MGNITATLTTTLAGVETAATMSLLMIISGLLGSFMLLLFILFYEWRIGIVAAVGMGAYLLVVNWQMKVSRKHASMLTGAQSRLAEAALTFLQGIKVTKAFCFLEGDVGLKEAIGESRDANIGLTDKSMPSQFAANVTVAVFEALILIETLFFCFVLKDISVVKTIVLVVFSFMVYASLSQAGSVLSMIGLLDSGLSEVEKLEQTEQLTYMEPVQKAAKAARCDEFIMKLPKGYDTILEEGGSSLSGGEKQRISIARAILKDSPIIILDEATSALDAENEHEILAAMDELTKNKTVIMIAHRIKSVQKADHIIAIKDGEIVQEGTHEQLLKEQGLYADFIAARKKAAGWKLSF